jgi:NAD-dependent SIR2 family protein deacetylase
VGYAFNILCLVGLPAIDVEHGMPEIAFESGAKLVIINAEQTPFDSICHLRFWERTGVVLPMAVNRMKELMRA